MEKTIRPFGTTPSGQDVRLHLLANDAGMLVGITDLGASLVLCQVPDGRGSFPDVTLGYAGSAGYLSDEWWLGAIIGRCANRIAGARFEVGGMSCRLAANDGPHNLHSGPHRWSTRLWHVVDETDSSVTFELVSRAGDQGFPGQVRARVTYRLTEANELSLHLTADPSQPTLANLTTHTYWNLNGHASGSVLDHRLRLATDTYTPLQDHLPTGEVAPVAGTPLDFRDLRRVADALGDPPCDLDGNVCLDNRGKLAEAARLEGERSGISMVLSTDACGLQVYVPAALDVAWAKGGARYGSRAGIALEPQFYPDAIHHKQFAQPVFTPERPFRRRITYAFGTV